MVQHVPVRKLLNLPIILSAYYFPFDIVFIGQAAVDGG